MDSYERILAVFEGTSKDRVPWNIRPEFWYLVNKANGTLPTNYAGLSILDVCREWGASWRSYSGYFVDSFVKVTYSGDVEFTSREMGNVTVTLTKTPIGTLRQVSVRDESGFSSRKSILVETHLMFGIVSKNGRFIFLLF